MRLDKFLKVSRLVKQRQKAKELCEYGCVKIDHKIQKAATQVCEGDIIELVFGNRRIVCEITRVPEGNVSKKNAASLVKLINEEIVDEEW